MTSIRMLSTLAVMAAVEELGILYEAETGWRVEPEFAPTVALLERLRAHEPADVAILTAQGIDDLTAEGLVGPGTRTDIALPYIGIAMRAGASRPDIASVAAFRTSLLAARSVAYSRIGASGIYFAGLLERLGIAQEVNAKAVIAPSGFTAELVASGEAELAVQQVSELMVVPGIEVIGRLPPDIQTVATFSGGILTRSCIPEQARSLLRYLSSPAAAPVLRRTGLEPA